MTRTNNDNNIKKTKKQCLLGYFFQNVIIFFKKYPFDFDMFKYFRIDIGPAVMNNILCQDLGPLFCGSTVYVIVNSAFS